MPATPGPTLAVANVPFREILPGGAAVSTVTTTMASLQKNLATYQAEFSGALAQMAQAALPNISVPQPTLNFNVTAAPVVPVIGMPTLDPSTVVNATLPALPTPSMNIAAVPQFNIPSSTPSVIPYTAPSMIPVNTSLASPVRPTINTSVTLPGAFSPTGTPNSVSLLPISVPAFVAPVLPTFSTSAPIFSAALPSIAVNWTEPVYLPTAMTGVVAAVNAILAGGNGLPPSIQDQMFTLGQAREARTALKAVQEAFDTFATKGYVVAPGMLTGQVNRINEQNQLQTNALNREVVVKVADVAIENLRMAMTQGIAAESILANIFNNAAQRSFDMAKYQIEAGLQLYNAQANVFNALNQAYAVQAQVYKTEVDAAISLLEVQRFALEQAKLTAELNTQQVELYTAQWNSVAIQAQVYKDEIEGQMAIVEVAKAQIEAYRVDTEAFATQVAAEKTKADIYTAQVSAEGIKSQINNTNAAIYKTLVDSNQFSLSAWSEQVKSQIELIQAQTSVYGVQVQGFSSQVQAQLGAVQATAEVNRQIISANVAQNQASQAANEAAIRIGQQEVEVALAAAQAAIKLYETNIQLLLGEKEIMTKSLTASGEMLATLAGGAMAAQHVQAGIQYSEALQSSSSYTSGVSNAFNQSETLQTPTT